MQKIQHNPEPIKTVLVIVVGFIIVYMVSAWQWSLFTALLIGIAGLASAFLARWIDTLWMRLARLLSLIVPNILLSTIFFLLLTPIALLSRILGDSDPLSLRNTKASMFKDVANRRDEKSQFEKPW